MKQETSKYTRLLSNTALFAISSFSSKVLSFLLTRLYTGVLAEASFGVVDLVTNSANLLIPLVSLGISNAVIRFGLEKGVSKPSVFTGGLAAIGGGFVVMLLFAPLFAQIEFVRDYLFLLYTYVLVSCLRTLCCHFVRAKQMSRLFAIDGILSTLYTVGFNVLFLVAFQMGPNGFLLSIIAADALSVAGLFIAGKLWQNVSIKFFNGKLLKTMLRYSLPLVPAMMFWWVTNASDRFFITFMCGPGENGLYAAAYKVPSMVVLFTTIFTEAWQMSAVTDGQGPGRHRFFTTVFQSLSAITFIGGGVLIWACRLIMQFLVAPGYYRAWEYIPFLVCATVFSCLVAFLNSVYMVEKRSVMSLVTMLAGAAANIGLNALLIPIYGPHGAAMATFASYVLVFIIRAFHTQQFVQIQFQPFKMLLNTSLLLVMCLIMVGAPPLWPLWCGLVFAALLPANTLPLYRGFRQMLRRRRGKGAAPPKHHSLPPRH